MTPESQGAAPRLLRPSARPRKIPDVPDDTPTRAIKKVAVIGAGTMGGGIAMNFLNAGIPVMMLEMKQEALDKGVGIIRKNYEAQVKKGKLKQDKLDERMALLDADARLRRPEGRRPRHRGGVRGHGRQGAGVQEARRGDEAGRDPRVATPRRSTSNKIAAFTKRPQDVIGMHFFSPANVMKLLEVVRGEKTAQGRARHRDGARQEDQEDGASSRACATASSATA